MAEKLSSLQVNFLYSENSKPHFGLTSVRGYEISDSVVNIIIVQMLFEVGQRSLEALNNALHADKNYSYTRTVGDRDSSDVVFGYVAFIIPCCQVAKALQVSDHSGRLP